MAAAKPTRSSNNRRCRAARISVAQTDHVATAAILSGAGGSTDPRSRQRQCEELTPIYVPAARCKRDDGSAGGAAVLHQGPLKLQSNSDRGRLTRCDLFGIPSTSLWTGAAIIVRFPRPKSCIVTRSRTLTKPMPSSGRVTYAMMEAAFRPPARTGARPDWMEPFARTIDAAKKYVVSSTWTGSIGTRARGRRGRRGIEAYRLEAHEPAGVRLGEVAMRYEPRT
jgi:hypothetical protein